MSIKSRIERLETRRREDKHRRPTFREWWANKLGIASSELDPRINHFRDLITLRDQK